MTRKPEQEDDFLARWSRRKQDARHAPAPEAEPEPASEPPAPDSVAEKSDEEILAELGLPDPDSLGPGADFKAFMTEAVPDRIRRRALRRLWLSNPALANLDELVDYGDDFTDSATVVANLTSAYKAGRGYFDKLTAEAQAEQAERADADEAPAVEQASEDCRPDDGAFEAAEAAAPEGGQAPDEEEHDDERPVAVAPPRRRMRFDFDEG